jgi:hypothetical protein
MLNPITAKDIQALVVTDGSLDEGGIGFGPKPTTDSFFTLSYFIEALETAIPGVHVTKAHRRADPDQQAHPGLVSNADLKPFSFSDLNLSIFDEIWLFGYEGWNTMGVNPGQGPIGDDEIAAITDFMNGGGGVFATGDHSGMGSLMCGLIPRVRSMRAWFGSEKGAPAFPAGYPTNAPAFGPHRLDTTQPGHDNQFYFDNQSDDIPQPL